MIKEKHQETKNLEKNPNNRWNTSKKIKDL